MQHESQFHLHYRHRTHLTLTYFEAGLVAGTAAFSSLAGVLLTGFASFLTSALAGAEAGVAGALAGSAANAVNANADTIVAMIAFIIKFPF